MSARNKHLEFAEITDFAPGLWTNPNTWNMPATAAQEMTGCLPQPGGGLRAAMKGVSFPTTGISANNKVIGLYTRGGIALRSGAAGDGSDRYVFTFDTSTNQVKVWRWDETALVTPTSWTLIKTHAAVAATPNPVIANTFIDAGGVAYVVYSLAQTSADDGVWSITYTSGTVTKRLTGFCTALTVQDDRIIAALFFTLRWSDSQSVSSWPAANNLPVQASRQGNTITSITAIAPSDLLIGTRFSAWTLIQGDITDPIVRTMSDARTLGTAQNPIYTTEGMAFIAQNESVFLTGDGNSFNDIAVQLSSSTWKQGATNGDVGIGNLGYMNTFLLAPHGLCYDQRVQSWFQLPALLPSDHWHTYSDANNRVLFTATGGSGFSLYIYDTSETSRDNTYTWKSAPIRHPSGRQLEIREVQLYAETLDSGASLAVTVNGVTHTEVITSASKQMISYLYVARGETLDVKIVANAGSAANEAPRLEVARIGSNVGHLTR